MPLFYTAINSPVGQLYLASNARGLCALTLGDTARDNLFDYLQRTYPEGEIQASKPALRQVIDQVDAYFQGDLTEFDLDIDLNGTEFQRRVWQELRRIPYGETRSYGELATLVNSPGGMRAVGSANGQNPIPIIIPCHRVIAADGSLGGYTGGLGIKHALLEMERQKTTPTLF